MHKLKKTTKTFSQNSSSQGHNLNPGPTEHETREVVTRRLSAVTCLLISHRVAHMPKHSD